MKPLRHVLGLSGGKDSSALAVYLADPERWQRLLGKETIHTREPVQGMEYFFTDTGKELDETYAYLDRLEAVLQTTIARLNPERDFDHYLALYGGLLPSSQVRWCTRNLKLRPFEDWIQDDPAISYVGIRADENRSGYVSTKPSIEAVFPFKEDGIIKEDVYRILELSGLGLPEYYQWRSRSGCYFCFFQRRSEWVGLKQRHPDLYEQAKSYEKENLLTGERFTWSQAESLVELEDPERMEQIMQQQEARAAAVRPSASLYQRLDELRDSEDDGAGCNLCHL